MALRIVYWTNYANSAIAMPIGEVLRLFDDYNRLNKPVPYKEKAPNTAIIQLAISQGILEARAENRLNRLKRWAVWIARVKGPTAKKPPLPP